MGESALDSKPRVPRLTAAPRPGAPLLAALAGGTVALALLFLPEIRAAVEVWDASTAYGHCYLVLPMALYLIWERRRTFSHIPARTEPAWALLGVPIAAAWLAAERLGIMEGRQLAAVAGFEVMFLCVLGLRLFRAISGPLLYLFFLVPFGAFVTPVLQRFTAGFSILGLDLLGVPNYSDNFTIETPAGVFFVAEACAGLRFLIAAVAFGVFYALLNYRSPWRRVAFIAASIVVPIVANGFRALGIVVLGQILGSAEAAAADHVIYGWVFFSIVMLLLVAAGLPLRETDTAPALPPSPPPRGVVRAPLWGALAAVILLAAGPAAATLLQLGTGRAPSISALDIRLPQGCTRRAGASLVRADMVRLSVECRGRLFEVEFIAFPARTSPGPLAAARRRATEELGAENATQTPLPLADEGIGQWTIVETSEPNRVTAAASWVDGRPARGGIAGRIAQAQASLLGTRHGPVLGTIGAREPERAPASERKAIVAGVRALVEAQSGLTEQLERLSRVP